jgi:hypothetical protein
LLKPRPRRLAVRLLVQLPDLFLQSLKFTVQLCIRLVLSSSAGRLGRDSVKSQHSDSNTFLEFPDGLSLVEVAGQ